MLFELIVVNTIVVIVLVALTFVFYARLPRPEAYKNVERQLPFVSVIIPARNEEANIKRCLDSFVQQDYPHFEIVVIDDRSTDATGQIIAEMAAHKALIKPLKGQTPPPDGWTGKNNALVQAVEQASGDWLYFADADTVHFPNSIACAIGYALEKKAQMVSFWPLHELGSFGERLMTPALWNSFFWLDPLHFVNDYAYDTAYAVGHGIVVEREAYALVGGHQSIHEWIIEDHALAKIFKNKGFHIQMADGSKLFKVRMYTSFEGFWHGWSKMLYSVIQYKPHYLAVVLLFVLSALVMPFVQLGLVLAMWAAGAGPGVLIPLSCLVLVQLAALLAWRIRIASHYEGLGWGYFFLLPVSGLVLAACYLNSAFLVLTGAEVTWKGRKYSVSRLKLPGAY